MPFQEITERAAETRPHARSIVSVSYLNKGRAKPLLRFSLAAKVVEPLGWTAGDEIVLSIGSGEDMGKARLERKARGTGIVVWSKYCRINFGHLPVLLGSASHTKEALAHEYDELSLIVTLPSWWPRDGDGARPNLTEVDGNSTESAAEPRRPRHKPRHPRPEPRPLDALEDLARTQPPPEPPPSPAPSPPAKPRPANAEPVRLQSFGIKNVSCDLGRGTVCFEKKYADLSDRAVRVVAALARVMPNFLTDEDLVRKVWASSPPGAGGLLRDNIAAANPLLKEIGLEIRKAAMGYMLATTGK